VQRPEHDHDDFCGTTTTVPGGSLTPAETCYAATPHDIANGVGSGTPTGGVAQDSNDDGFPDALTVLSYVFTDKNSDSDNDGCSDYAETSGGAAGSSACGSSFGVAPGGLPPQGADPAGPPTYTSQCGVGVAVCLNAKRVTTNGLVNAPCAGLAADCFDGAKDDPNGTPDWRDLATDPAQHDSTVSPLGGSPDSDLDGCTNRREALADINQGGTRNALNKWDFFDVDTGSPPIRSKAIAIGDVLAIVSYIGVSSVNPLTPNANGKTYAGDENLDSIPNFEIFDRSPAGPLTGPPSGSVAIGDALSALAQIGDLCSSP
jgi:hypothetical protein